MAEIHPSPLIPAQTVFFSFTHLIYRRSAFFSGFHSPTHPLSLFCFCSRRLCFTDGKTRGDGSYAKHISNECWAATMKKASKTGTQILILLFLGGKSCVADSKIREEDHFSLQGENIETVRAKGIMMNIYRLTFSVKSKLDRLHLCLLAVSPHNFAQVCDMLCNKPLYLYI